MIKNFLASAVGLRKETATLTSLTYATNNVIAEGLVVQLADNRYGVVFDEKDVTGKATVVVGVVTAGHVLNDKVNFGSLTKATVIEAAVNQGLFFEDYKSAKYPADDDGEMKDYVVE